MQVKIAVNANMAQAKTEFAALTNQVDALNAAMRRTSMIPQGGSPAGFIQQQRAMKSANAAYNAALASSGKFRVEQVKLNDVIDRQTQLLQKQKLTFRDIWGKDGRAMMKQVKNQQLAMQNMATKTTVGTVGDGKLRATMAIPTEIPKSWDNLGRSIGFTSAKLSSASGALVNWGKNTQWAGRQLMAGLTMPIAAFGAATAVMAYKVDEQLTRIQKVYDTTASVTSGAASEQAAAEKELAQVREDAYNTGMKAARDYGAQLTDTLSVQAELAATGQKGVALQKNTNEVMRISMLGEMDKEKTTQALIALQSTLGLNTKETADAFNYMNAVENATSLSMQDFATAIPIAAGPIKEMGGNIKDLGLLMVAMKERGIQAGKGANAIKAMMTRIYRPSKQVREEWQKMAGIDPLKIVQEEGGNIMKILPRIAKAVDKLPRADRNSAIAGLFGAYQVQNMTAMLDGIEQMGDETTQTYRAMDVANNSAAANAKTAEAEQKRQMESTSGQFRKQLATLQASLSQMGEPFLKAATQFLKYAGKIVEVFNNMPDGAKKVAAWAVMIGAVVGPLIMLTGLFANFIGMVGRMIGAVGQAATGFKLLNKTQFGERIASKLATLEMNKNATAAELMTNQVTALTQATRMYTLAMMKAQGISPIGMGSYATPIGPKPAATPNPKPQAAPAVVAGPPVLQRKETKSRYHGALITTREEESAFKARQAAATKAWETEQARLATQTKINQQAAAETAIREKSQKVISGTAVAGGVMAASMATLMVTSNKTATNIAQMAMLATIVAPAAQSLVPIFGKWKTNISAAVAAQKASAAASMANAGATAKVAGGWRTVVAGSKGAMAGIAGMMGPVGWIAAAVTAIGFGIYKWAKHEEEVTKQKQAQVAAMMDEQTLASDMLKISQKRYKYNLLSKPSPIDPSQDPNYISDVGKEISSSKSGKKLIGRLKEDDITTTERATIAQEEYIKVLQSTGGNAKKAQAQVNALFQEAGYGATKAANYAASAFASIGNKADIDEVAKSWGDMVNVMLDRLGQRTFEGGKTIGSKMGDAIASGVKPDTVMKAMTGQLDKQWDNLFNDLKGRYKDVLASAGVTDGESYRAMLDKYKQMAGDPKKFPDLVGSINKEFNVGDMQKAAQLASVLRDQASGANKETLGLFNTERGIAQEMGRRLQLSDEQIKKIKTLKDLQATYEYQLANANGDAMKVWKAYSKAVGNLPIDSKKRLELARTAAVALGQDSTKSIDGLEQALANAADAAGDTADGIGKGSEKAKKLKSDLQGIPQFLSVALKFDVSAMTKLKRTGMEGVTNDIADAASAGFDERMNASLAATSASWDKKIQDQQNAGERASQNLDDKWQRIQDRFEKRYDRRKNAISKYYDARIKKVDNAINHEQKAEDIRQKIFEAEKTRIQRLSEMQNKTIDFNMNLRTGNLDEAAKIKTDMEAQAQDWLLSDAQANSQSASDKRAASLGARKDNLEAQRDKALKALDRREKDEKASLDRREKAEKRSLDRRKKANADALKRQADAANASAKARWDREKASFDQRLMLFKSYIARDDKDLKRWMKSVGISYDKFGKGVKGKGESWSKFFEKSLTSHMRIAANEMATDNSWANLGYKSAGQVAKSMGFPSMKSFRNFVATGNMPDTFGQNLNKKTASTKKSTGSANTKPRGAAGHTKTYSAAHSGGVIGKTNNRVGVARTMKGLAPSEQLINAQKGEFLVNRRMSEKHGDVLNQINSGNFNDSVRNTGDGVGGGPLSGLAGIVQGIMGAAMVKGMAKGLGVGMQKAQNNSMAYSGSFGAGTAGQFGDRSFSSEQLKNAAIIANVGSGMGMSKRDIEIGIMTAITESGLVNLHSGDRDSQGLFQQRPSQGWGTVQQVTNPRYAAGKFFSALKSHGERNEEAPWLAAQHVQRSAFSDGSNYRQYWNEAVAIMSRGLRKQGNGDAAFSVASNMLPTGGTGGWHRPSVPGKGWVNSHDYRNGLNSPLYAYNDGRIIESRRIRHGGSGENPGAYPKGYSSYGVTVVVQGKDGNKVRYAHMYPGTEARVGPVKGGALIGRSAATGNASGFHTHFEVNGSEAAQQWFASHGIGLSTGGYTMSDGIANLHKNEVVISPERTNDLYNSLDNFSAAMNSVQNTGNGVGGGPGGEYGNLNPGQAVSEFVQAAMTLKDSGATNAGQAAPANGGAVDDYITQPSSGKSAAVRTGAYNVLFSTTAAESKYDLSKLTKAADVLSLTEFNKSKRAQLTDWFKSIGWRVLGNTGKFGDDAAVAYNTNKYNVTNQGRYKLNDNIKGARWANGKGGTLPPFYANYARLQDKTTKRSFWQIAAHTVAHAGRWAKALPAMKIQFAALSKLVDRLNNSGDPVFLAGDLNRRSATDGRGAGKGTKLSTIGLQDNWRQKGVRGDSLDHVLFNNKAKFVGQQQFKGFSDHKGLLTQFNLPGLNTGGYTMSDGLAMLHKKELVLDPARTKILHEGIDNLASGTSNVYNINVDASGSGVNADDIVRKTMQAIDARDSRMAGNRGSRRR